MRGELTAAMRSFGLANCEPIMSNGLFRLAEELQSWLISTLPQIYIAMWKKNLYETELTTRWQRFKFIYYGISAEHVFLLNAAHFGFQSFVKAQERLAIHSRNGEPEVPSRCLLEATQGFCDEIINQHCGSRAEHYVWVQGSTTQYVQLIDDLLALGASPNYKLRHWVHEKSSPWEAFLYRIRDDSSIGRSQLPQIVMVMHRFLLYGADEHVRFWTPDKDDSIEIDVCPTCSALFFMREIVEQIGVDLVAAASTIEQIGAECSCTTEQRRFGAEPAACRSDREHIMSHWLDVNRPRREVPIDQL